MAINLPLDSMTTDEKIQAMESLWQDLCEHAEKVESPGWHGDVLSKREKDLAAGKEQVLEWETAKEEINKKL